MEAKDLMIGDWVKVDDIENPYPLMVTEIYKKSTSYYAHLINNEHNEDIKSIVDRIEPIPLTEEILKANGFESKGCYYQLQVDGDAIVYNSVIHDFQILTHREYIHVHVDYVHELQHTLRQCGLTDLIDNFKVE